nr:DciA family protein [uncultured Cohaesibacter sp.]
MKKEQDKENRISDQRFRNAANTGFRKKGAVQLRDVIGSTLTPLCRKQGFASSDILRYWGEIVGPQFADCTEPERIRWPRRNEAEGFRPGTLVLHCEGAQSVFLQHEQATIIQRVNAYFGYPAVDRIQILQRPVNARSSRRPDPLRPLTVVEADTLEHQIEGVTDDKMAAALRRLGHAVLARN